MFLLLKTVLIVLIFLEDGLAQYRCDSDTFDTSTNTNGTLELKELFPYYIAGFDFDNLPVLVMDSGHWDYFFVSQNLDKYKEKVNVYMNEFLVCLEKISNLTVTITEEDEIIPGEFVIVADFDGFNVKQLSTPASANLMMRMLKGLKTFDNNVAYGFYINMNAVANNFVRIAKPLMSKAFGRSQVFGTRKQSWIPALQRKMPKNILPSWYGGDFDCNEIKLGCVI